MDEYWNPILLRGLCEHMTPRVMLEVIAQSCDETVAANVGKPAGTYASINSNLIRLTLSRMVDAPAKPDPPLTCAEDAPHA